MDELREATTNYAAACRRLAEVEPEYRKLELLIKVKYGIAFSTKDGTIKDKEALAVQDPQYIEHLNDFFAAQQSYIVARADKEAKQAKFECARSGASMDRIMLEKNIFD